MYNSVPYPKSPKTTLKVPCPASDIGRVEALLVPNTPVPVVLLMIYRRREKSSSGRTLNAGEFTFIVCMKRKSYSLSGSKLLSPEPVLWPELSGA
jgi:hypothetical protein